MELKEFVSEALKQVIDGIEDAQKYVSEKETNAVINPSPMGIPGGAMYIEKPFNALDPVEFDIALTTEQENTKSGKAKISVLSLGANASTESQTTQSSVSRIKFLVRVVFPTYKIDSDD